jgi:hypothetical protein
MWHALPRDVASWWRRRGESSLHLDVDSDRWHVSGPATDDAVVRLTTLDSSLPTEPAW